MEINLPGLLVSLDFEKAFDSITRSYIHNIFKIFCFGNKNCQWIAAFYNTIKSSRKFSSSFFIKRGFRQGDPVSPYLFILCAEIFASTIRDNTEIKGIKLAGIECKISQCADDASLFLEEDKQ